MLQRRSVSMGRSSELDPEEHNPVPGTGFYETVFKDVMPCVTCRLTWGETGSIELREEPRGDFHGSAQQCAPEVSG